ncbi:MAG TPA: DUF4157 domain-containing protein, partial [Blastocatellia bacterium]|nr:DUF4157 domain-containing protein [Blastocatellia bacterium]
MAFAPLSKPQSKAQGRARPVLQRKVAGGLLQRKCACGGRCEECSDKKPFGLQTKLKVSEAGDQYEQEADRVADRVMAGPAHPAVSSAPPRIQRLSGDTSEQLGAAPSSVGRALAGSGRPLEPALRLDMEQRFGYDFSRVRVHSDRAAGESARDVNAHAYTVGHDIVFSAGQFVPGTHEGRRLIAHELTHVVQQTGDALSPAANAGSSRALLQRAPDETRPGTESDPLKSPYPEEMDILRHALRLMGWTMFKPG